MRSDHLCPKVPRLARIGQVSKGTDGRTFASEATDLVTAIPGAYRPGVLRAWGPFRPWPIHVGGPLPIARRTDRTTPEGSSMWTMARLPERGPKGARALAGEHRLRPDPAQPGLAR